MSPLDYALRVLATAGPDTTHLKLQKLLFYAYGAARAHSEAAPRVPFRNWQHGPVCVEVYEHFKERQATPLGLVEAPRLDGAARDAVRVYGLLSAWQLREESHLEAPWRETALGAEIPESKIVEHFKAKFGGRVSAPQNLAGSWSLAADGLPALRADNLGDLAKSLGR